MTYWYQFFSCCEESVSVLHRVKFAVQHNRYNTTRSKRHNANAQLDFADPCLTPLIIQIMKFSIWLDSLNMGWSIVYMEGFQIILSLTIVYLYLKINLDLFPDVDN